MLLHAEAMGACSLGGRPDLALDLFQEQSV